MGNTPPACCPSSAETKNQESRMGKARMSPMIGRQHFAFCAPVSTVDAHTCQTFSDIQFSGILRNVSPIPPPSIAAMVDIDNELILPTLLPVISSVSLPEVSQRVQELIAQEVCVILIFGEQKLMEETGWRLRDGEALAQGCTERRSQEPCRG